MANFLIISLAVLFCSVVFLSGVEGEVADESGEVHQIEVKFDEKKMMACMKTDKKCMKFITSKHGKKALEECGHDHKAFVKVIRDNDCPCLATHVEECIAEAEERFLAAHSKDKDHKYHKA